MKCVEAIMADTYGEAKYGHEMRRENEEEIADVGRVVVEGNGNECKE